MQFYHLEVPVDIIINRNTTSIPGLEEEDKFDETRNKIAVDKRMDELGCVVPFIEVKEILKIVCPYLLCFTFINIYLL